MDTPTRRDLFKYAVGATLVSALPLSAQCPRDTRDPKPLQLSVDLTGPMAFIFGSGHVEIRLPILLDPHAHEGALRTAAGSIPLYSDDYSISLGYLPPQLPPSSIYLASNCTIYSEQIDPGKINKKRKYISFTLPMPDHIVALSGVPAWIYTPQSTTIPQPLCTPSKPDCTLYALGLRFLYNRAGTPTFTSQGGPAQTIPLCVASFENQVIMSISYVPVNQPDDDWAQHARTAFNELASLFGLSRAVEIEANQCRCEANELDSKSGKKSIHRPCQAPIMAVTFKS